LKNLAIIMRGISGSGKTTDREAQGWLCIIQQGFTQPEEIAKLERTFHFAHFVCLHRWLGTAIRVVRELEERSRAGRPAEQKRLTDKRVPGLYV